MGICFLVHNLNQDNGGGVFAVNLINGIQKALECEVSVFTTIKSGYVGEQAILHANWLKFVKEIPKLRNEIKKCDVVHVLDMYPYGIIATLAALGLKKKLVITCAGSASIIPLYSKLFFRISAFCYRKADLIVAISNFTKNEILKKVPDLKIEVINPGVDFEKFGAPGLTPKSQALQDFSQRDGARLSNSPAGEYAGLAKFGGEALKPYLLSVGSLRWRKGFKLSIKAFAKVSKVFPELKYVIIGKKYTDKYYNEMQSLISTLGLVDKVIIIDSLDDQKVLASIYGEAELFFLMSQTGGHDVEGFGMVFLEAAAAGLPVVGPKGSGVEDAVLDGKNGILVPDQQDIDGFAGAIIEILSDKEKKSQMSQESIEFARLSGWEAKISKYIDLYKK